MFKPLTMPLFSRLCAALCGLLSLAVQAQPAQVQWAAKVLGYSSEYQAGGRPGPYSAQQILGKPNKLPAAGSSPCAWSPAAEDGRYEEWIKVGFERPMPIGQVAIGESYNPGAISKVYLYDQNDREYLIYQNADTRAVIEDGRMFRIFMETTPYVVAAVKVVLSTVDVPGWNHLDAIGIANTKTPIEATINVPPSDSELGGINATQIENLGPKVNSAAEEIVPVISPDGRTLYFDRKNHPDNVKSTDEAFNDDIWFSTLGPDGQWQPAQHLPEPLNNDSHNFVCTVTPDGNTLLLANKYVRGGKSLGGLSLSHRQANNEWGFPEEVRIDTYYNLNKYSEFYLANNQQVLLLAIERADALGNRDLYVSLKKPDGTWSVPQNMGPTVNTAASEMTPFLASDGRTLYFSSNGFSGYGETDMYVSRRLDDSWMQWSEPMNLGPVLNSKDWDASYTLDAKGEYAYFVSYNNATGRSADIFRARLPKAVQPDAVVMLVGRVFNSKTKEPLAAQIVYETLPDGKVAGTANANPTTGEYKIVLPYKSTYGILAKSPGFLSVNENIDLVQQGNYVEVRRDLYLTPLEIGQSIRLNNVFFEQGQAVLLAESYPELNRIAALMTESPGMEIELEGHTDIEGPAYLNMKLSEDRVRVIKAYLVERGVQKSRIATQAYGPKKPLTRKRDEESKRTNRRVEFKVTKF